MIIAHIANVVKVGEIYYQPDGRTFRVTKIETYRGLSEVSLIDKKDRTMKVLSVHWYESELRRCPFQSETL